MHGGCSSGSKVVLASAWLWTGVPLAAWLLSMGSPSPQERLHSKRFTREARHPMKAGRPSCPKGKTSSFSVLTSKRFGEGRMSLLVAL